MKSIKQFFHPPVGADSLVVNGIGIREEMPAGRVNRPAGTGDYLFMLFHDPVDIAAPELKPYARGHMVVWRPTDGHGYGNAGRRWRHTWIHCEGSFVSGAIDDERLETNAAIRLASPDRFVRLLEALYAEIVDNREPDSGICRHLMACLVRETARAAAGGENRSGMPAFVLDVRRHLELNYTRPQKLEDIARQFHVSVPHLCSEFKKHVGVPVMEFVIRRRLREAEYLLCDSNLRVGEVARRVGYDDIYHFSKLFKKRFGRSPRQRQKQHDRS